MTLTDLDDTIAMAVPPASSHLAAWLDLYIDTRAAGLTVEDVLGRYRALAPVLARLD
ncbi:hypothetical protein [Methylobrevis pamukkalensis]|uniref:Uncharacterized protein n=1 Tax=Methylobrevis pamukkalensis TaxID=1439726 RepID=A0A1E3H1K6_9HYPH|nr:hypothetical protein [Methylobrevis pamukkalensis]ODN70174.1 hypothetical protein A6302_02508 [Methylobrevis pamukkalensis]